MDELPNWVAAGASFHMNYKPGNIHHGRKYHVRGIVDGLAVIREWFKHKQRWNYTIEGPEYFDAFARHIVVDRPKLAAAPLVVVAELLRWLLG
jgi:hypothetical protein